MKIHFPEFSLFHCFLDIHCCKMCKNNLENGVVNSFYWSNWTILEV